MTEKQTRNEAELAAIIMQELRKDPECAHIDRPVIMRQERQAPHLPNWNFAFGRKGGAVAPEQCNQIVRKIQNQFDLA